MAPDPSRSRAEYLGRVCRVLDHVDRHLADGGFPAEGPRLCLLSDGQS